METGGEYSASAIANYLGNWEALLAATEGGTGSLAGRGGGRGDRLAIASLVADLEQAADELPLDWSATLEVFRLQGRLAIWRARRLHIREVPLEDAIAHMATRLGHA